MSKFNLQPQAIPKPVTTPTPEEAYEGVLGMRKGGEKIVALDLDLLDEIHEQPFKVKQQKVDNYAASIAECGLIEPIQVMAMPNGRYEILAGRHRFRACRQLGHKTINCIVKNGEKDDLRLILLKSNTDRQDDFLPSELGFAYAEQEQILNGKRDVRPRTEQQRKHIQRCKRITQLIEPLRDMVDENKIKLSVGAELSHLTNAGQQQLAQYLLERKQNISEKQAHNLRDLEASFYLTEEILEHFFHPQQDVRPTNIKLKVNAIQAYLPAHVIQNNTCEEYIIKALEFYKANAGGVDPGRAK